MSLRDQNQALFEEASVPKALAAMAIPTIISQLITLIYNLADAFFVGRTGNPYMIAAVSLVFPVFAITVALSNLFGVGGGSLMSRCLGEGDEKSARQVSAFSLYGSLAGALVFSLTLYFLRRPILVLLGASPATYAYTETYLFLVVTLGTLPTVLSGTLAQLFRSVGFAKKASFGLSLGAILNIILDPLFMFVLLPQGEELTGAALATLLSNLISLGYFLLSLVKTAKKSCLAYTFPEGLPSKEKIRSVLSVGFPSALTNLLFDTSNLFLNHLMAGFGDAPLAALGIVMKAERIPLNTGLGICQGMLPLVAYHYGARKFIRMKAFIKMARRAGLLFSLLCVLFYELAAVPIASLFIAAKPESAIGLETLALGALFLRFRCLASPFAFLNFHITFSLQALGDGRITLLVAALRQAIIYIPLMHAMGAFLGYMGLIESQTAAEMVTFFLARWIFSRRLAAINESPQS